MSCIKDGAKIGCKYLDQADRDTNNLKIHSGVYDFLFNDNNRSELMNIPYYLSKQIENNDNNSETGNANLILF